jgi:hypothetical protein
MIAAALLPSCPASDKNAHASTDFGYKLGRRDAIGTHLASDMTTMRRNECRFPGLP